MIKPEFNHMSKDIVLKGRNFYAYWNGEVWIRDEESLLIHMDQLIWNEYNRIKNTLTGSSIGIKTLRSQSSGAMTMWREYIRAGVQRDVGFNKRILFKSDPIDREDYATGRLDYDPVEGSTEAFDEMYNTLYSDKELEKILWFIGATLTNDISKIEKFMYLYGGKGTGKGTVIRLIKQIFEGYWENIDLQTLTSSSEFATHQVQEVPMLIDEDTNISKIDKDTNLLKLTSHEPLTVNQKYLKPYTVTFHGLMVAASNQRFKVRNVDSGIVRRAIVIEPSKTTVESKRYSELMSQIKFEIPHIAYRAMRLYEELGQYYYDDHVNVEMLRETDHIFDFMRAHYKILGDECTLKKASELYKIFLEDIGFDTNGYKRKIKTELQRYYKSFLDKTSINGEVHRNVFKDLDVGKIFPEGMEDVEESKSLDSLLKSFGMNHQSESIFDEWCSDYPAQEATQSGIPKDKWDECKTILSDLDTTKLHYVQLPGNHIVVDLDIKNEFGEKDLYLNLEEARKLPRTYTETSKSGQGIHLHYIWDGEPSELASLIKEDVEIKVFKGNSSLRRKLSWCNDSEIKHISTGLPYKEDEEMRREVQDIMWNEKKLRSTVEKNLRKEYHNATKPSIDFIAHILNNAESEGVKYDLTDMRQDVFAFAMQSSNQAKYCMGVVKDLNFNTMDEETVEEIPNHEFDGAVRFAKDEDLYFFDVEVFPNLLIVAFKQKGKEGFIWYNPSSEQIESLINNEIVGFNNRRYDNHILYGALLGNSNLEIYRQSMRIINNERSGTYGNAYELSYADIYEYNSKKQSLKKWEVEMGIKHDEFEEPWDQPLDESKWERAGEYCMNDVIATEALFDETRYDYTARCILSTISGMSVNATTQQQAARIIFGTEKRPQDNFIYTDLSIEFPGYEYSYGKSNYRGEDPSEGGYVHSEPGVYSDVGVLDVRSMHPYSLIELNYFGQYTQIFKDLVETRVAIKEGRFDDARKMYEGRLKPFLEDESKADELAYALKIIINIVYGMTSAKFDNKFRHPDNVDNIVAKRGALFMIDLKHAVQEQGYTVAHIKTDSIKIPNMDDKIKDFVFEFGKKYGYVFEHEATYEKMALVNKAVLVAKYGWADKEKLIGTWSAVGAQFAEPYVFKTLFSGEKIEDVDYAITKQATAPIYIGERFVGKIAQVYASKTGGEMMRVTEEKTGAVTGTKGHLWKLFSEYEGKDDIDMTYYDGLLEGALDNIDKLDNVYSLLDKVPESFDYKYLPF